MHVVRCLSKHAQTAGMDTVLAVMEEDAPVCDRFLTFSRFAHTQLMISLVIVLIRISLHSVSEQGKK